MPQAPGRANLRDNTELDATRALCLIRNDADITVTAACSSGHPMLTDPSSFFCNRKDGRPSQPGLLQELNLDHLTWEAVNARIDVNFVPRWRTVNLPRYYFSLYSVPGIEKKKLDTWRDPKNFRGLGLEKFAGNRHRARREGFVNKLSTSLPAGAAGTREITHLY